jgi:hypothetical protein
MKMSYNAWRLGSVKKRLKVRLRSREKLSLNLNLKFFIDLLTMGLIW